MYQSIFKRILDIILTSLGMVLLFPMFITFMIILWFKNDGQPFYYQNRPGKGEKLFTIIKFKSMNDKKDSNGQLLPESQRLTSIGEFIRKFSLDEIPQLLNVMKGDMSLVGPRPLLPRYLPRYNEKQKHRHDVKPGITGWAQVNGRNSLSWEQKFEYDIWYVNNLSFLLDMKIMYLSIIRVLHKEDVYTIENDITPEFMGSPNSKF
ncbi:sugar transferase [Mangrovimonas sp. TPBH4]|uniref:sugar transferase n=1 Tax=Mangrovimonas sp. TPBH4 TaxID=1645914 RepID=UPI0006B481EF|nr:sugar transferase [Mangrovimonas sp. TPBH4]